MNRLLLSSTSSILRRGVTPASAQASAQASAARATYPTLSSLSLLCHYSTTTPNPKIQSNNDKLTQAEMEAEIQTAMQNAQAEEQSKYNTAWKPGQRKKPLRFAHTIEAFDNEQNPAQWISRLNRRCGAMGIKLGMMPIWDEWGERHACTVLYLDSNIVLRKFTQEEDGYVGVQVGAGQRKKKNVTKPLLGHYKKHGIDIDNENENGSGSTHTHPPYVVREFRLTHEEYCLEQGDVIHARHFTPGQNVDVSAISKGKGFQGAMKRWNFAGLPATHGTSRSHRSLGSTGQCQDPGRVFKGKKMAGRMGTDRVTTQNLRIVKIDRGRNLIYIKGPVPGQKGNFVEIRDAVKKPLFGTEKVEGEAKFPPLPTFEYEEGVDGCGEGGFEIMMPQQKDDPFDPIMDEAA